jgi:hypothetical protein
VSAEPENEYPWQRFWCAREQGYTLSDYGYLLNPEQRAFYSVNANLKSTDDLAPEPCLVLLGEPGIGKSQEIQKAVAQEQAEAETTGDAFLLVDLKSVGSEATLYRRVFDEFAFRQWVEDT